MLRHIIVIANHLFTKCFGGPAYVFRSKIWCVVSNRTSMQYSTPWVSITYNVHGSVSKTSRILKWNGSVAHVSKQTFFSMSQTKTHSALRRCDRNRPLDKAPKYSVFASDLSKSFHGHSKTSVSDQTSNAQSSVRARMYVSSTTIGSAKYISRVRMAFNCMVGMCRRNNVTLSSGSQNADGERRSRSFPKEQ